MGPCSGIETVVENTTTKGSSIDESALCTFCEMIVFWIQMQLKQQKTKDTIFKYVNEVFHSFLKYHINVKLCSLILKVSFLFLSWYICAS